MIFKKGNLTINYKTGEVKYYDTEHKFNPLSKYFAILVLLSKSYGELVRYKPIIKKMYGRNGEIDKLNRNDELKDLMKTNDYHKYRMRLKYGVREIKIKLEILRSEKKNPNFIFPKENRGYIMKIEE
jgi:hypothetical protein